MPLAPYRLVWISLWVEAPPSEGAEFASFFRDALAVHGEVEVSAPEQSERRPGWLRFGVEVTPHGSTAACLRELGFRFDEIGGWEWPGDGGAFLHPAVRPDCVTADKEEAAAPPRFRTGDVVRVGDCTEAREEGLVGAEVAVGSSHYLDPDAPPTHRTWDCMVHRLTDSEELEVCPYLPEHALTPTGRWVELYDGTTITVSRDGEVLG